MAVQEILLYLLAAIAYFVPFYIARYRRVNGQQLIFWFNLLFGWTLIAWVILIIVALSLNANHTRRHSVSI
ncbi:MAG: superinfection immunity protein [Cyclobacteriaceae bacterium]|nr:superinfection immunity protein [Cyclobacteriaceae bacterium]